MTNFKRMVAIFFSLAMILVFMPSMVFAGNSIGGSGAGMIESVYTYVIDSNGKYIVKEIEDQEGDEDPLVESEDEILQLIEQAAVARVNNNDYYDTLKHAFNAANNGDTITVLKDTSIDYLLITGKKNLVLDLNEKTVTFTKGVRATVNSETLDYDSNGTYTVTGSLFIFGGSSLNITGNGAIGGGANYSLITNLGKLTIQNGTFSIDDESKWSPIITNNYNGQVTINGGTIISSARDHAIYNNAGSASNGVMSYPNSKIIINGGNIKITSERKNAIDNFAIVEINGGTITGGPVINSTIPCSAINSHAAGAVVTINGGTINAGNESEYAECFSENTGTIVLNGGTYNRYISGFDGNGHVSINGIVKDNNNGTWTVKKTAVIDEQAVEVDTRQETVVSVDTSGVDDSIKTEVSNKTAVKGVVLSTGTDSGLQSLIDNSNVNTTNAASVDVLVNINVTPQEYTSNRSASFSLEPTATVRTLDANGNPVDTKENVAVTNEMLDQTHDISVSIYTGFKPKQIIHRDDSGEIIEVFDQNNISYNAGTGVATVIIHRFSVLDARADTSVASYVDSATNTVKYADTLQEAVEAVTAGQTITLLDDVSLNATQVITKDLTINLNGHNITATDARALWIKSGEVTITGNGTVEATSTNENKAKQNTDSTKWKTSSSVIRVGDKGDTKAALTIGKNVTVATDYCYGVTAFGTNEGGVALIVNGTVAVTGNECAISGNGNSGNKGAVTINEGAVVSSANEVAIYHPQDDKLIIAGGTITGTTAVYVKCGNVSITGGTLEATGAKAEYSYNNNGCNATGDALVIDNCNYPGGVSSVTVSGGTFTSTGAAGIGSYSSKGSGTDDPGLATVTANSNSISLPEGEMWVETATAGEYEIGKAVAKIGNTSYATLEAAFAAAKDGDTIVVLDDCEGNGIIAPQGKFNTTGLTVDFNGHTYTVIGTPVGSTGTETIGFQLLKDNKITFKGGTITGSSRTNRDLLRMIQNYSNLTLDNMTITLEGQYYNQTTMANCNGTTVIKDSTINAPDYSWINPSYTDSSKFGGAAFSVGTFSSYTAASVDVQGTSVINGNVNVEPSNNGATSLTLTSGSLNGGINMEMDEAGAEAVTTVTKQTSFTQEAPEGYTWVAGEGNTQILAVAVATVKIGEDITTYGSLQAAVEAANAAGTEATIQMLNDVSLSNGVDISGNIILDLNGRTISDAAGISTDYLIGVLHGGTLTVNDTAGDGKVSMRIDYCAIKMTVKGDTDETNPARLIVNAGTIEGYDFGISGNGSVGRGNVLITVNGGTIRNTKTTRTGDDAAIYQPNTGTVTLNGGTITGLTGVEIRSGNLVIPANSTVVVTGTGNPAEQSGNGNGTTSFGAGIAVAQHTTAHDIKVSIAGGNVYGATALALVNPNGLAANNVAVTVSGGTFIGTGNDKTSLLVEDTRVTKFVSGGSFSNKVDENLCATGYTPVIDKDENGLYTVVSGGSATYSATLTLNENINVNFYVKSITPEEAPKYTVYYKFNGTEGTLSLPASPDSKGRYKVVLPEVFSYQMGVPFDITVRYEGAPIKEYTYSASTYFHNMINMYDGVEKEESFVDLCRKALDFGANAQLYFDGRSYEGGIYDTDVANLVNADTNSDNTIYVNKPDADTYKSSKNGSIEGITNYSASLILGSETSIKIFMTGEASDVQVSCNDSRGIKRNVTAVKADNGRYSFKVTGIRSYELYRTFDISITKGGDTVVLEYSPYTYARNNWDNAEISKLCQALVAYGNAAQTYWPDINS